MTRYLLVALLLLGCADAHEPSRGGPTCGKVTLTSPAGARVAVPSPLVLPVRKPIVADILHVADTTYPDTDPRIADPKPGVPPGFVLVVEPGKFATASSPTGLASGETDMHTTIWVALRLMPNGKLLPALGHELTHVYTQDARAGH